MEEKKSLFEKVKALLAEDEVKEQAFLDVKTSEGVVLRVDEVAEGATVTIISEDGENVSGAADYTLEDGTTITVSEEGVITSVMEAEGEDEVGNEEVAEEEMQEEEVVAEVNPNDERIAKLEESIEKILSQFEAMNEQVEKFASAPADEEVKIEKKKPTVFKKESAIDALSNYKRNKNKK